MPTNRIVLRRGSGEEGEKPFWISYADLMTALMVLFLVVMVVALLSVTTQIRVVRQEQVQRDNEISDILRQLQAEADKFTGITVSPDKLTVDFGEKARFIIGDYRLSPVAVQLLRDFVPSLIKVSDSDAGKRWFKRVVVEGFTDQSGSYLLNLDLSLKRAHSVVCALLAPVTGMVPLTPEDARAVRTLFLVGGYSSNAARASREESRRVELRLEFRALGEPMPPVLPAGVEADLGRCLLP